MIGVDLLDEDGARRGYRIFPGFLCRKTSNYNARQPIHRSRLRAFGDHTFEFVVKTDDADGYSGEIRKLTAQYCLKPACVRKLG